MTVYLDESLIESVETDCTDEKCLKKTFSITGIKGYKVVLSKFEISLANIKSGILSTCTITADGKQIASWSNSNTVYTSRSYSFSYEGEVDKDVVIKVYLKTANKSYKALAKNLKVTYELVAEETQEEQEMVSKAFLVVECASQGEASELAGKIKEIAPGVVVGIVAKV